jgi:hypothetical protein
MQIAICVKKPVIGVCPILAELAVFIFLWQPIGRM